MLAELVKTYNPRVVVTAGERPSAEWLGRGLVVCPGRLAEGRYSIVDVTARTVEPRTLSGRATTT